VPSNLSLNAVLRDTEKMVRRLIGEDVELTVTLNESLPTVHADRGQLEQVILNLVVNARDAMPRGGQLRVSTYLVDAPIAASGESQSEQKWACLEVKDTGHGMPPEVLARIFEPFFTTKDIGKGTGLGLSTVYGIVTQSNGVIKAQSRYLEGSTFQVMLPPSAEQESAVDSAGTEAATLPEGLRVLLIEDDPKVMAAARRALEGLGCAVVEARSPEEAVRVAQSIGKTITVLVADIIMPKKSGPEVAREVSKVAPNIRVLFMTGYMDEVVEKHLPPNDTYALLQKPFTQQALKAKLIEALAIEHPSAIIQVQKPH
jgi:two-component system cell cycle sensor histidine kinase/response regulator CckA